MVLVLSHLKGSPSWFKYITQCLSHSWKKYLWNSYFAMHSSAACESALSLWCPWIFILVTMFLLSQNKLWRLGWRNAEARYHHHLFLVRHLKKLWICVAWRVVMTQKPVLCMPLVCQVFSPSSFHKKLLVLLCRTVDSKAGTEEKNSFWRTA